YIPTLTLICYPQIEHKPNVLNESSLRSYLSLYSVRRYIYRVRPGQGNHLRPAQAGALRQKDHCAFPQRMLSKQFLNLLRADDILFTQRLGRGADFTDGVEGETFIPDCIAVEDGERAF